MFQHTVTASGRRAQTWLRLFGTETLPVVAAQPRLQETRHGTVLAFDLAVSLMSEWQLARLAAYVSNRTRRPYTDVLSEVREGWPLVAEGLEVNTAVSDDQARPLLLDWIDRAWRKVRVSPAGGWNPFFSPSLFVMCDSKRRALAASEDEQRTK